MERILYSLGFSGYRARLYSALLKTGKATVPEISKNQKSRWSTRQMSRKSA
ncbi:MAG: hypothetical protein J4415_03755 [Candidatus Diapherotrites archaeon]|uniref:Uncharacterized protein n=1 Tax=Candidatus Iainarchaeum sp. TaxID=3101447 RepID=A0A8T4KRR6_9ARCH|nr:hypothetical protein [Candidatus Diapherotrites archaeon]